jgi:fucose permease
MSWRDEMVFLGILNAYMVVSVGIEGTLGNWLYTLAGGTTTSGFSQATWVNTALWGSFTLSRIFLVIVTRFKQEHVLYCAHALCFAGTLCGLLALYGAQKGGGDNESELVFPMWALWTLTVSFGIGIAPSFPNVIGLANRLYPGTFSGVTQSVFGISANAGNGALPGIAGLLAGVPSIGKISYLAVPLIGVVTMQCLLWALICVAPQGTEGENEDDDRDRRDSHFSSYA